MKKSVFVLLWCAMLVVLILRLTGVMQPALDLRQITSFTMIGYFTALFALKEKPRAAALLCGAMAAVLLAALLLSDTGSWCQAPTEGELIFSALTFILLAVATVLWFKADKAEDT